MKSKMTFSTQTTFATTVALAAFAACTTGAPQARADVTLPSVLSDGMVLQRSVPVRIYGKAAPGEAVTVTIAGQTATATTDPDGAWVVLLKPLAAGGPHTLDVRGRNAVSVKDVLVGEVWVCSGQSNMEWTVTNADTGKADMAVANDPQLRVFTVPRTIAATPQGDIGAGGNWQATTPQTTGSFTAVGYYMARDLRKALKVPVGIINTSWGGTRIEAWTSKPVLLQVGVAPSEFDVFAPKTGGAKTPAQARYERLLERWKAGGSPEGSFNDPGVTEAAKGWSATDLDEADWKPITLPGIWDAGTGATPELDSLDGAVWFRRTVTVDEAWADKAATLTLGAIDDHDQTFVNGVKVGATGPETESAWMAPRRYALPAGTLKPGKNVIAVRVWDGAQGGGFTGPADALRVSLDGDGAKAVSLAGPWNYKVELGRVSKPAAPEAFSPNAASGLYNAMLAPLAPYTVRGAAWYQGESNAGQAARYRDLLSAMVSNWRATFQNPAMPFLVVELAPFGNGGSGRTEYAELRESQRIAARQTPGVYVASTVGLGDEADIHPRQKAPVGARLALLARRFVYNEKVNALGPTLKNIEFENGKAVLTFDNVGKGLKTQDANGKLLGFTLAGPDGGAFVPASAVIRGKNQVIVASPDVSTPFVVRYGFVNYGPMTLYNSDDLPAYPFRSDEPLIGAR